VREKSTMPECYGAAARVERRDPGQSVILAR